MPLCNIDVLLAIGHKNSLHPARWTHVSDYVRFDGHESAVLDVRDHHRAAADAKGTCKNKVPVYWALRGITV